ncbi:ABC transporter ATP-binding protein [Streptomyces sp. NBC_01803]|uniref:ABC transporter ATP-binding protein n=1 Tax=Streptomyces sp. NBC_01803 TaxID=2975946 RepID=UPI002DDA4467|nr:ABC transporter ATP-binding protein [Streptomyces sp. NBC_01803]WSA44076.1 ABC transporter ATP-binding protein [Streptomyces sp. NBC_01803]
MTDLRITGLTKSYGGPGADEPVLRGLDLDVTSGDLTAVLGPSGCGKTTLLRVVAGFLRPDHGTVTLGGRAVTGTGVHIPPEKRAIGIVAQEGALFPHLSVARNVAFGLTALPRRQRQARAEEFLELVGLAGLGSRMPHELSGGQQQRVSLARALAPRPTLVLLDEPFNALDSALRAGLRDEVRAVLRTTGATAVLVTHDQQEALSVADRVAVLRDGKVAQHGTPQEIYRRPADPWVASFIGDAVLLPGQAAGRTARTPLGDIPLTTATDGTGSVLLRPEQLLLSDPTTTTTLGTVAGIRYYGHDALVSVTVRGLDETITVRHTGPLTLGPGDPTGLTVTGNATLYPQPLPAAL